MWSALRRPFGYYLKNNIWRSLEKWLWLKKRVLLKTDFGADRIVDMMVGGQQPKIFKIV